MKRHVLALAVASVALGSVALNESLVTGAAAQAPSPFVTPTTAPIVLIGNAGPAAPPKAPSPNVRPSPGNTAPGEQVVPPNQMVPNRPPDNDDLRTPDRDDRMPDRDDLRDPADRMPDRDDLRDRDGRVPDRDDLRDRDDRVPPNQVVPPNQMLPGRPPDSDDLRRNDTDLNNRPTGTGAPGEQAIPSGGRLDRDDQRDRDDQNGRTNAPNSNLNTSGGGGTTQPSNPTGAAPAPVNPSPARVQPAK